MAKNRNTRKTSPKAKPKAKSPAKKIKKIIKRKVAATKAAPKKVKKNKNLEFYNKLKSQVSHFYKDEFPEQRFNRVFIESKTRSLFTQLKATSPVITNVAFKGFVNNLDAFIQKPSAERLSPELISNSGQGIDWWNIEMYIDNKGDELSKFKSITVDLSGIIGPGNTEKVDDPDSLDLKRILKDIRNFVDNHKRHDDSQFLFFNILISKDGKEIIFELTDNEPLDKIEPDELDDAEVPFSDEAEEEVPEPVKPKKKKGKKEEEEPEEEKPAKEDKEAKARKAKKENIEIYKSLLESYQKSFAFNNQQIKEIAGVIKVLKEIEVPFTEELKQIKELQKSNVGLSKNINEVNSKMQKLQ